MTDIREEDVLTILITAAVVGAIWALLLVLWTAGVLRRFTPRNEGRHNKRGPQ